MITSEVKAELLELMAMLDDADGPRSVEVTRGTNTVQVVMKGQFSRDFSVSTKQCIANIPLHNIKSTYSPIFAATFARSVWDSTSAQLKKVGWTLVPLDGRQAW